MSLIGIVFGIAFLFLLGKAILETIWGTILIIHGLFCHALAAILDLLAAIIRIAGKSRIKPQPQPLMIGDVITLLYSSTPEGERMRANFRRLISTER